MEDRTFKEGQESTRQLLEKRAQAEADRVGAICPQSGCLLKYRQRRPMTLITCVGPITIRAWSGYSRALRQRVHPLRQLWGLTPHQQISPELDDRLVFTATTSNSFQQAAKVSSAFEDEFAGMARNPITLAELQQIRRKLKRELPAALTPNQRQFLLGLVAGEPDWRLMKCPHLSQLPAIRWKLQNLAKLKKSNLSKFTQQAEELRARLAG